MTSEAQQYQKRLDDELAKPLPDSDVVYALQATSHLWNTVDTERTRRGLEKLGRSDSLTSVLAKLSDSNIRLEQTSNSTRKDI